MGYAVGRDVARVDAMKELGDKNLDGARPSRVARLGLVNVLIRRFAETLSKRNEGVTCSLQLCDDLRNNLRRRRVDLVVERQDSRRMISNASPIAVKALGTTETGGVTIIKVPVHEGLASRSGDVLHELIVFAVRGSGKRRVGTCYLVDGVFDEEELGVKTGGVEGGQVKMRPRMRRDLVTSAVCILEAGHHGVFVDTRPVISIDEESSFGTRGVERINNVGLPNVRAVVKSQGNGPGHRALSDNISWGLFLQAIRSEVKHSGRRIARNKDEGKERSSIEHDTV